VQFARNNRANFKQELCRHPLKGRSVELGIRELRGAGNGDKQVKLASFGAHFGNFVIEIADGIGLELSCLMCSQRVGCGMMTP
jgi:hypothetical protein